MARTTATGTILKIALLTLCLALWSGAAPAGMIGAERAAAPTAAQAARERIQALAERPELSRQLEKFGLSREQAKHRIDAMSDDEVLALAGRLDALPAGGAVTNEQLIIIILIVLLIVILI